MRTNGAIRIRRWYVALIGVALMVVAGGMLIHSVRAGRAARLYYQARFGKERTNSSEISLLCMRAFRMYPHNYHFCALAAETAHALWNESGGKNDRVREELRYWIECGMEMNPYLTSLHWLKTRYLMRESPARALEVWRQYTQWHFWDPYNHAYLAQLYAWNGDYAAAEKELVLARRSDLYEQAQRYVKDRKMRAAVLR